MLVVLYVLVKMVCFNVSFVSEVVLKLINGWNGVCLIL